MAVLVYLCLVSLGLNVVYGLTVLQLNGQWTVSNKNKSYSVIGDVPGSMYTALIDNGVIGDPYYRTNDGEYRWIAEEDWTYTRTFTVSQSLLQFESIMLVCEGLDTIATVYINNHTVDSSVNMFVRYIYNVKDVLVPGQNHITVQFLSAIEYGRQQQIAYPYSVLPEFPISTVHGYNHVNMIRKEQCSFAWDWGPAFPTQGVWYVRQ